MVLLVFLIMAGVGGFGVYGLLTRSASVFVQERKGYFFAALGFGLLGLFAQIGDLIGGSSNEQTAASSKARREQWDAEDARLSPLRQEAEDNCYSLWREQNPAAAMNNDAAEIAERSCHVRALDKYPNRYDEGVVPDMSSFSTK